MFTRVLKAIYNLSADVNQKKTLSYVVVRGFSVISNYIFSILVIQLFSKEDYGTFIYGLSVFMIFSVVFKFGVDVHFVKIFSEFKKIFGNEINNIKERSLKTAEAAKISNTIVVLKGADTVIASPSGEVVINKSSAAYLATAGSGDVLAGIISSLVGKNKMSAFDAACAGVWIHSEIGEILGSGMIAEDIIDMIPITVKKLIKSKQL